MGVKEKYESGECIYDLVDGQQRFTTLWLMANELGGDLQSFTRNTDQKLRLRFAIRDKVEAYFEGISRIEEDREVCPREFEDLVRIGEARLCIQALISEQLQGDTQREDFVRFLMQKVRMIFTEVPVETKQI